MKPLRLRHQLPRLYRLAVLLAIVWLIHAQHQSRSESRDHNLNVAQVSTFFPGASDLGPRESSPRIQAVKNAEGSTLGLVLHTAPDGDRFRGYVGSSDVLVAMDPTGRVIGASLLSSEDTADHVAAIVESDSFWRSFHGLTLGSPGRPEIDVVSGSTLTCDAIVQSVIDRLGGAAQSLLFPTEILLVEVQQLLPAADSMKAHPDWPEVQTIYDKSSNTIAQALRTAPSQDNLIGYQGPSDVLVLLDPAGQTVLGLRLRKSFDNEEYSERIPEHESYLKLYNGLSVNEVAEIDFAARGIEGVSGATLTSWALAEGVKRRLGAFLAERNRPPPPSLLSRRDLLLIVITLGALLMAFTKLRGRLWVRTIWQVVLVLVLGFLTGDLLSQALLAGWAQNGIAWLETIGLLFLATAAFVVPWSTGKQLYCHHLCPHGALQQWIGKLPVPNLRIPARLHRLLSAVPLALLALVLASVMLGLGVNLAALEAFDAYLFRVAGWLSISLAVVGLLASAFIPLAYCKYGCPTGLLLKFLRWRGAAEHFDRRDLIAAFFLFGAIALSL